MACSFSFDLILISSDLFLLRLFHLCFLYALHLITTVLEFPSPISSSFSCFCILILCSWTNNAFAFFSIGLPFSYLNFTEVESTIFEMPKIYTVELQILTTANFDEFVLK